MATVAVSEDVTLSLPNTDLSFLRTLSKKMGWTMRRHRKTGIEKGLEDIRKGNVFHAKNSEDLIKQILGWYWYPFWFVLVSFTNLSTIFLDLKKISYFLASRWFFRPFGGKQYVLSCVPMVLSVASLCESGRAERQAAKPSAFGANERTKENIHPLQGDALEFFYRPTNLPSQEGFRPLPKPLANLCQGA